MKYYTRTCVVCQRQFQINNNGWIIWNNKQLMEYDLSKESVCRRDKSLPLVSFWNARTCSRKPQPPDRYTNKILNKQLVKTSVPKAQTFKRCYKVSSNARNILSKIKKIEIEIAQNVPLSILFTVGKFCAARTPLKSFSKKALDRSEESKGLKANGFPYIIRGLP